MKRFIALFLIFALAVPIFYSCTKEEKEPPRENLVITENEARETLALLIEGAYEINEIFFGKGLPYDGEPNSESAATAQYLPVSDESPYLSIKEIKIAAEKIYSDGYLESVYGTAFEGITIDSSEAEEGYAGYPLSPRYKMFNEELRVNAKHVGFKLNTVPLAETAIVVAEACTPDYVTVQLNYTRRDDASYSGTMRLQLSQNAEGQWRLDSPTY